MSRCQVRNYIILARSIVKSGYDAKRRWIWSVASQAFCRVGTHYFGALYHDGQHAQRQCEQTAHGYFGKAHTPAEFIVNAEHHAVIIEVGEWHRYEKGNDPHSKE